MTLVAGKWSSTYTLGNNRTGADFLPFFSICLSPSLSHQTHLSDCGTAVCQAGYAREKEGVTNAWSVCLGSKAEACRAEPDAETWKDAVRPHLAQTDRITHRLWEWQLQLEHPILLFLSCSLSGCSLPQDRTTCYHAQLKQTILRLCLHNFKNPQNVNKHSWRKGLLIATPLLSLSLRMLCHFSNQTRLLFEKLLMPHLYTQTSADTLYFNLHCRSVLQ